MNTKPKIIVLCGSSRFTDVMAVCAWFIERDEHAIALGLHLLPRWYSKEHIPHHLAEHEGVADAMDELHLRKIDMADEIFVVDFNEYFGQSTAREIEYAKIHGKKTRWFTRDPIGEAVLRLYRSWGENLGKNTQPQPLTTPRSSNIGLLRESIFN